MGSAFLNFLASWKLMGKIEEHEGKKYLTNWWLWARLTVIQN